MKLLKTIILMLTMLITTFSFAYEKPPPPAKTGSDTLDAINKFVYDTVNWKMGDPIPNTGSSTLNAIARSMLNVANHGCTGTSSDGSYSVCKPKSQSGFGGGGASGSWGGDRANDPYSGNGGVGNSSPTAGSCLYIDSSAEVQSTNVAELCPMAGRGSFTGKTRKIAEHMYYYQCTVGNWWGPYIEKCDSSCPFGYTFDSNTNKCIKQCPERQILDPNTNQCVIDPNQCLSPYTLINGICVPPKKPDPEDERCPYGYEKQGNLCIAKPLKGDCDPTIQNCDEKNNSNDCSEICPRLDTIIRNQGTQIQQQNTTNRTLSEILAQQQTTNLKLDAVTQRLDKLNTLTQDTNNNLKLIQQQLAVIEKLLKDGIRLDIEPILKKVDEVIANDNKNHEDLTGLIAKSLLQTKDGKQKPYLQIIAEEHPKAIASAVASTVKPITDNQEKQIDLLEDIKDLLELEDEEKKELPNPNEHEQAQNSVNPFDNLKNYDISKNRFGGGSQCPADRTFVVFNRTFAFPMSYFCEILASLAPLFLAVAYISGGIIIVKGAGGN